MAVRRASAETLDPRICCPSPNYFVPRRASHRRPFGTKTREYISSWRARPSSSRRRHHPSETLRCASSRVDDDRRRCAYAHEFITFAIVARRRHVVRVPRKRPRPRGSLPHIRRRGGARRSRRRAQRPTRMRWRLAAPWHASFGARARGTRHKDIYIRNTVTLITGSARADQPYETCCGVTGARVVSPSSMNHLGNGLWRVALALLLVVASLMMFTSPPGESLLSPLTGEICSTPVAHDVPFLSRQQSAEDTGSSNVKKWSEPPSRVSWDRRLVGELQILATCVADTCRPPSVPRKHATARGPPA